MNNRLMNPPSAHLYNHNIICTQTTFSSRIFSVLNGSSSPSPSRALSISTPAPFYQQAFQKRHMHQLQSPEPKRDIIFGAELMLGKQIRSLDLQTLSSLSRVKF